jgi:hypothetical protein
MVAEEILTWHLASDPPDDEVTVLVHVPEAGDPVHMGFHCDGKWFSADRITQWSEGEVKSWAHVPAGRVP